MPKQLRWRKLRRRVLWQHKSRVPTLLSPLLLCGVTNVLEATGATLGSATAPGCFPGGFPAVHRDRGWHPRTSRLNTTFPPQVLLSEVQQDGHGDKKRQRRG